MAITVNTGGRVLELQPALAEFRMDCVSATIFGFKSLLETKHLYQSVEVDLQIHKANRLPDVSQWNDQHVAFDREAAKYLASPWLLAGPNAATSSVTGVVARPPDVKLFCCKCGRVEPCNLVTVETPVTVARCQVFVLSYLCQSCKAIPEVFLVRRSGFKLTLSGRAPIEEVTVPSAIPKEVTKFFSGAIVAHQSGQTLSGLFMLRTLIEQWARFKMGPADETADVLLDRYMASLAATFNGQFPSMRALYSLLSEDIHNALGSAVLFDRATGEIDKHFDARRLFEL